MRANTVLAGSKLKLERFVMLLWNFAERGKTYLQISTAANLPAQSQLKTNCREHRLQNGTSISDTFAKKII